MRAAPFVVFEGACDGGASALADGATATLDLLGTRTFDGSDNAVMR